MAPALNTRQAAIATAFELKFIIEIPSLGELGMTQQQTLPLHQLLFVT
jgi:hypothetical protein